MIINCPNCRDVQLEVVTYTYSWLNNKPTAYIEELRCPKCHTKLRASVPITCYRESD